MDPHLSRAAIQRAYSEHHRSRRVGLDKHASEPARKIVAGNDLVDLMVVQKTIEDRLKPLAFAIWPKPDLVPLLMREHPDGIGKDVDLGAVTRRLGRSLKRDQLQLVVFGDDLKRLSDPGQTVNSVADLEVGIRVAHFKARSNSASASSGSGTRPVLPF